MTSVEISDWDDLDDINLNLSGNYIQVNDIDENSTGYIGTGAGWTGIGNSTTEFSGTYNGDGYSISDLFINSDTTLYRGLFAYIKNATLQNINLYDIDIYDADGRIGGLVGLDYNSTTSLIENCHVTGDVGTYTGSTSTTGNGRCGGLIGWAQGSNIKKCSVQIAFTPEGPTCGTFCGRLIDGDIEDSYSISNFLVAPNRTTNNDNGGFIGLITGSTNITNCYFKGDVNVRGEYAGGFTSRIIGGQVNVHILNCYVIGDVIFNGTSSSANASGFVTVYDTTATVNKCYWVGTITNNGFGNIFMGAAGVEGHKITNCFYDLTIEPVVSSAGSTGKTTTEMKDINTYTDTDTVGLTTAWNINDLSLWKTDSGEITSSQTGAPNWLRDTTKDWDTDEWIDYSVIIVDEGITRVVTSNTSTYIYTTPVTWGQILTVGSFYVLTKLWFIDDGNDYPRLWFEYEEPVISDTDKMFLVMM